LIQHEHIILHYIILYYILFIFEYLLDQRDQEMVNLESKSDNLSHKEKKKMKKEVSNFVTILLL
jgi:hypothetical protein